MHSCNRGAWPGTKLVLTEVMACPGLPAQEGGVKRESEANFSLDDTTWLPALSKHPQPSMKFKASPTPQPLTSKEPVYSFLSARAFLSRPLPACACRKAPSEPHVARRVLPRVRTTSPVGPLETARGQGQSWVGAGRRVDKSHSCSTVQRPPESLFTVLRVRVQASGCGDSQRRHPFSTYLLSAKSCWRPRPCLHRTPSLGYGNDKPGNRRVFPPCLILFIHLFIRGVFIKAVLYVRHCSGCLGLHREQSRPGSLMELTSWLGREARDSKSQK